MVNYIRIGKSGTRPFDLQPTAATQTFGILAKRRGGKSYTAAVMAEEFVKAQVPFTVLDPTGAWWGLRASADGEKAGLPVVVLGGAHGDAPLEPHMGKHVADLVVDHPGWYVLDLDAFESQAAQDRFVHAFASRLYLRKAKDRTVMHLFIDEADEFVPQRPGKDQLALLGAFENIVRRGGIRGLGTTLITQRAAVVNKNVLTQLDTLIVLQTTGPQDQDAEIDWVRRNATPDQLTLFKATLASLPRGTAWVYSPELGIFQQVAIRERRTFNSSKTPEAGETIVVPKRLAQVDLQAVMAAMAETIEKDKANDPALLKRKIADLERALRETPPPAPPEKVEVVREVVPQSMLDSFVEGARLADEMRAMIEHLAALFADVEAPTELAERIKADMQHGTFGRESKRMSIGVDRANGTDRAVTFSVPRKAGPGEVQLPDGAVGRFVGAPPETEMVADGPLQVTMKAGARRMLDLLARHHPVRVTRAQWATLAGMKVTGGTWGTYFSTLKRAGLIEESDGLIGITAAGLQIAGVEPGNPMTQAEVLEVWRSKLKAGARNMLDVLTTVYPAAIQRDHLAERINMEPTGGTFGTYLSTLRRNGLAEDAGNGAIRATDAVMGS